MQKLYFQLLSVQMILLMKYWRYIIGKTNVQTSIVGTTKTFKKSPDIRFLLSFSVRVPAPASHNSSTPYLTEI